MLRHLSIVCATVVMVGSTAVAQDVRITPNLAERSIILNGQEINISRNQDQSAVIQPDFAKTSCACPPFCIHPMEAAEGVETVAELEVMDFLELVVANGEGLLIDSRVPDWHAKGTIPGAVNVPFTTLEPSNPYRDEILKALGATNDQGYWDFTNATQLTLFCNGPWCDQSPRAIRNLIDVGYPAEKIKYYRGGMQNWLMMGLTTNLPGQG